MSIGAVRVDVTIVDRKTFVDIYRTKSQLQTIHCFLWILGLFLSVVCLDIGLSALLIVFLYIRSAAHLPFGVSVSIFVSSFPYFLCELFVCLTKSFVLIT